MLDLNTIKVGGLRCLKAIHNVTVYRGGRNKSYLESNTSI